MTERWRKRLGDLDKVGPDEQVFHRAAAGPQLPNESIPLPSRGSRVVGGVAAFVVFALAISVFVIPALRMDQTAGAPGEALLPLWPARTLDEAERIQAAADAGDEWAFLSDPRLASQRFASTVLGWDQAGFDVQEEIVGGLAASASGYVSYPYASSAASGGGYTNLSPASGAPTPPPTGVGPGPFRSFTVTGYDNSCPFLDGCKVTLTLFQPLEQREGAVWMVLNAQSPLIDLSVGEGVTLTDGDEIAAGFQLPEGGKVVFGYHVGAGDHAGSGDCALTSVTDSYRSVGEQPSPSAFGIAGIFQFQPAGSGTLVQLDQIRQDAGCVSPEPGYVFAAMASSPITGDGHFGDPIAEGEVMLFGLTAVPVAFAWDEAAPLPTSLTPTSAPTPTEITWTSYTDPLGWTIDVPTEWESASFDEFNGRVTSVGAWLSSNTPTLLPGDTQEPDATWPASGEVMVKIWNIQGGVFVPPADDSVFPLSADDVLAPEHSLNSGGWASTFRGDGLEFTIMVRAGDNAPTLTGPQEDLVRRMIESIRFEPWSPSETRNGWTALEGPVGYVSGPTWMTLDGVTYVSFVDTTETVRLYGPVASCGAGETMTSGAYGEAVLRCPDGSSMVWDENGQPVPTGPAAASNPPLDRHPVVIAHDHSFIAELGTAIS